MNKKIDVLLPTYNGEKYVAEQIESILNQTYQNIRLIISDDCSNDGTVKILEEYEKKDNRITVFVHQENQGVVKNIEYLINLVESDYFMLADQDDVWMPLKIEKSLEKIEETNSDLVFGDLEVVDENLKTIYPSFNDYMLLSRKINKYLNNNKLNYIYNCVTGCTILAKKETIKYILPIPKTSKYLIHDHWIGIMVSLYGKVTYMPEKYIKYRQHGNNQIGTNKISHGFKNIEQVRELFINVKLGVFKTFVKNKKSFPKEMQVLNEEIYDYFKMIQNKNNFNFKNWSTFHKLYKTERFSYYIENFVILNLPAIGRPIFKIRYIILKLFGKR